MSSFNPASCCQSQRAELDNTPFRIEEEKAGDLRDKACRHRMTSNPFSFLYSSDIPVAVIPK